MAGSTRRGGIRYRQGRATTNTWRIDRNLGKIAGNRADTNKKDKKRGPLFVHVRKNYKFG
jgi:hypothetical protein